MNGIGGLPTWQEARNSDGRVYYYNTVDKKTQWTKPEALMTPAERALANQPWKEYTAEGGKKYWYNTETKTSSWEMPEVYKSALAQQSSIHPKPPTPAQPSFVAGGLNFAQFPPQRERDDFGPPDKDRGGQDRQQNFNQSDSLRSSFVPTSSTEPDYASYEEAEAAFMKLLRRSGVQPDWTWEQTMKAIIKDPQYRALKDPKDRKAAFEKHAVESRIQDKERAKERLAKLRQDFGTMLKSHPEIKHYTRWKTARPIIEGETIFRSTSDDTERRQLFEEYIISIKKAHAEKEISSRKAALEELVSILQALELEPYTRWSDAQGIIDSNERFKNDDKFQTLTKSDILTVFENHIKSLERTFNDARQLQKTQKTRIERQIRDQFIALLRDLRVEGKIRPGTKWMEVHPLIEDDPRYVAMLGQAGSTPLDLFWDMVEEEERALRGKRNEVLDVLDDKRYEITPKTTLEDFMTIMLTDRRTSTTVPSDLELIFNRLHEKVTRRTEEDKHHLERQQRKTIDALRSRIKHLDPPVLPSETWEQVRPRVEKSEEYRALNSDELRRTAFDKVLRRLKEKEHDAEQTERTRRAEPRHDRDHSLRNGHRPSGRGGGRYSRTPEPDAYEADRKKAMADRERQYRKSSATGLSPPPPPREEALPPVRRRDRELREREREREREERDRERERYGRRDSGRLAGYERDRRAVEMDRERWYVSRADPRDVGAKELDYGESGRTGSMTGSVGRRRRESTGEEGVLGRRDVKRLRRDKTSRPPVAEPVPVVKEEETALRSGSEEGEIEED